MNCPKCARTNPDDARFCIYCAASFEPTTVTAEPTPAIGPTTRLDPTAVPSYTLPTSVPAAPSQASVPPMVSARRFNKDLIGPVWLIGLGILFLTRNFFPGILILLCITAYLSANGHSRSLPALQPFLFFGGIVLMFSLGLSWPFLLLWLGLMAFMNQHRR